MSSLALKMKAQLEANGELVDLANVETGWFAFNPNTWSKRIERCKELGRVSPNLVVYRTRADEERDHHVIPYECLYAHSRVIEAAENDTYRWNLTLASDRLLVTHRKGYEPVAKSLAARLIVEESDSEADKIVAFERVNLRTKAYEEIVEGIARESVVLSRTRSAALRREALKLSGGICAACGVNFSLLLSGLGYRALQAHPKKQLALIETPEATSLADLAVVCANCHAIIHTDPKKAIPVEELRNEW